VLLNVSEAERNWSIII